MSEYEYQFMVKAVQKSKSANFPVKGWFYADDHDQAKHRYSKIMMGVISSWFEQGFTDIEIYQQNLEVKRVQLI